MNAADAIKSKTPKEASPKVATGKTVLKMVRGAGWTTPSEVHFSRSHPFQVVPPEEIDALINSGRFEISSREEVLAYYEKS